ncbi:MAG: CHASE3 domain-containing protein [Gemmatimonadaceae bacterium]|nr:CHASE3 domain-containing protein [Gloeobacterales cyanobacterium ES-bin-141]
MKVSRTIQDLSISNKLYFGFGGIIAILIITIGIAYLGSHKLSEANGWNQHTYDVIITVQTAENNLLEIDTGKRGFILTGQENFLDPYISGKSGFRAALEKAKELTLDNPDQQARLKRLADIYDNWLEEYGEREVAGRRGVNAGKITFERLLEMIGEDESKRLKDLMIGILKDMKAEELTLLKKRTQESNDFQNFTYTALLVGGSFGSLLGVLLAAFLTNSIVRSLRDLVNTTKKIANRDFSSCAVITSRDEIGQLGTAFNVMANTLHKQAEQEGLLLERERETSLQLQRKVDLMFKVVARTAEGDLTCKMPFSGEDTIGKLADGIQMMIDNLSTLISQVQKSGLRVTAAITSIAANAREQEATTTEQAATSVQIMNSTREISTTSQQLVHTMHDVGQVAEKTASSATDSQTDLEHMETTMQRMVDASGSVTSKLAILSEKAGNINSVVTTIVKVADQTNLLSLNAAIEAEKAGEHGRGFAVVATEIRRLADQTAVASWDIEQIIKEIQTAVSAGVMSMDKFSEEVRRSVQENRRVGVQFAQIIEEIKMLVPQFEQVGAGMKSQSSGAEQISAAVSQLSEATQQTAESLRQSSEAIEQLNEAVRGLQTGVSQFKVGV